VGIGDHLVPGLFGAERLVLNIAANAGTAAVKAKWV
jgi:hypothetical protein